MLCRRGKYIKITKEMEINMSLIELFILAVGLSMVLLLFQSVKGLSLGKIKPKHMCIAGAWFGGFQALMPLIGISLAAFLLIK